MDIEQSSRVGPLLSDLIEAILPPTADTVTITKIKSYCARLLSSRLPSAAGESEEAITAIMRDQVLALSSSNLKNDNWGQKRASRFQECIQRLNNLRTFRNKTSVLKLLSSLSTNKADSSMKGSMFVQNRAKPLPDPGSILPQRAPEASMAINQISRSSNQADMLRQAVVREVLFVFQGIESNCIKYNKDKNGYEVDLALNFDKNEREIVLRICEMGVIYSRIKEFLDQHIVQILGLVSHSLAFAIREELNEYYRFITTLESMRDTSIQNGNSLSFMSIYLWTLEPLESLRWILILCDSCKNLKGGMILSALFSYTMHGCQDLQVLVNRLLVKSLAPFMRFLEYWIYKGELVDPMEEFFVQTNKQKMEPERLWSDKYRLRAEYIPNFISRSTAEEILSTGKTTFFLRNFIQRPQWHLSVPFINVENLISFKFMEGLKFRALENWVHTVSTECNLKLKEVLTKEYDFLEHCRMIKNFLLLGKGDFINALLDSMQDVLEYSARNIFKHNLNSLLDSTKGHLSLSSYKKTYLDRVVVHLFDQSVGSKGWDIFSLHYEVDPPLNTIFDSESMAFYHEFFKMVWRIKHLIACLNNYSKVHRRHYLKQTLPEDLLEKVTKCNFIRHQMLHFLNTFLSYVMLEVVETEWSNFLAAVEQSSCFDEMIHRHKEFIERVQTKVLLRDKKNPLYIELIKLLGTVENFNRTQSVVFIHLEERFQYEDEKHSMDEEGSFDGESGDSNRRHNLRNPESSGDLIKKNNRLILGLWKSFREGLDTFLEHLELDQKLKSLSFRLDFNEFYKQGRQTRKEKLIIPATMSLGTLGRKMDIEGKPPGRQHGE
jgi:gamma-tubulin complex component 3